MGHSWINIFHYFSQVPTLEGSELDDLTYRLAAAVSTKMLGDDQALPTGIFGAL